MKRSILYPCVIVIFTGILTFVLSLVPTPTVEAEPYIAPIAATQIRITAVETNAGIPATPVAAQEPTPEPETVSLGEFRITYYCPGSCCNGVWADQTSTGNPLIPYRTIAVDPGVIPYGSTVVIDGQEYIAHDTGGAIKNNRIDICVATCQEARECGVQYHEVFMKEVK